MALMAEPRARVATLGAVRMELAAAALAGAMAAVAAELGVRAMAAVAAVAAVASLLLPYLYLAQTQ